jgi:hypothetical protein
MRRSASQEQGNLPVLARPDPRACYRCR